MDINFWATANSIIKQKKENFIHNWETKSLVVIYLKKELNSCIYRLDVDEAKMSYIETN